MKKFISLFLFALVLSACSSVEKAEYLDKNSSELNASYNSKDYNKFISDLNKNEVFLAGEMHGIKENYTLRLNLLMYLNENAGVKYYLAEMGYSSSFYLNKYLSTGDEKYLFLVTNSIVGSYDYSVEDVQFWRNLYRYNILLPKKNRIRIVGLDLEHQFWLSILHLEDILKDKNLGPNMKNALDDLACLDSYICPDISDTKNIFKNISHINISQLIKITKEINIDFENRRNIYKKELSREEFYDLEFILSNSIDTERIYANIDDSDYFNREREKSIYNNFLRAYGKLGKGKYFGQWGGFHILQKNSSNENSFAAYLDQESSIVHDKVISIKFVYDNKKHKKTNKKLLKAFKEYSESKFTLYKLDTFKGTGKEPCPINDYEASDITEYFQYGILIRNPQKVTAL